MPYHTVQSPDGENAVETVPGYFFWGGSLGLLFAFFCVGLFVGLFFWSGCWFCLYLFRGWFWVVCVVVFFLFFL